MNKRTLILAIACFALCDRATALTIDAASTSAKLDSGWTAIRGDSTNFTATDVAGEGWTAYSPPSPLSSLLPGEPGIYWLRVRFTLEGAPQEKPLGICLGKIDSASEVYVNGALIGSAGRIDAPAEEAYDRELLYEIPSGVLNFGGENVVAIRTRDVFRYRGGGIYSGTPVIGELRVLIKTFYVRQLAELVLILLYVTIGAHFLMLFTKLPDRKDFLMFSVFLFMISVYAFFMTQWKFLFGWNFETCKLIERIILPLLVPALSCVFYYLVFQYSRKLEKVYRTICRVVFILSVVLSGTLVFLRSHNLAETFIRLTVYPLIIAMILLTITLMLSKSVRRLRNTKLMLAGIAMFSTTVIIDILSSIRLIQLPITNTYGIAVVILAIDAILTRQFVGLFSDMETANLKLAEEQLVKDQFISNLSHEIHTPITAILGNIELAIDGDDPGFETANRHILDNCDLILAVTDKILLASALEEGRVAILPARVSLSELTISLVKDLQKLAKSNRVRLKNEVPEGLFVIADYSYARTAIEKVIENGILFNKPGGEVVITAEVFANNKVAITVKDTGIGIDDSVGESIFGKFYRADRSATYSVPGTGISLFIVKKLMALMNGAVGFESEEGKGSEFYLTFPKG